jgi:hypothetical protein
MLAKALDLGNCENGILQRWNEKSGGVSPESRLLKRGDLSSCRVTANPSSPQLIKSCSAVLEAAEHEKKTEKSRDRKTESKIGPSRSGSIQGRRHW